MSLQRPPSDSEDALAFADDDPDPVTQQALERAVRDGDAAFLAEAMRPRLEFGTAGLRGAVGPGPARMNVLVCARFAWALGTFLGRQAALAARGVVLGFDGRRDSERFARTIEEVLGGLGVHCVTTSGPVPTPVVAFGVRYLAAAAGVVVTASHNPAGDNGIKLYDAEGIQIVAPWDHEIEALMRQAPRYRDMVRGGAPAYDLATEVVPAYLESLRARALRWPEGPRLSVAYTPVHGVGAASLRAALRGFEVDLRVVQEQAEPDPDFPTAPFPNPEEPGVLDRLLALAREERVDLALANDPDADRFAAALPDGQGNYVTLSGDEVSLLLADGLARAGIREPVCVRSVVSSPGLDRWAQMRGGRAVVTLTGFKWLSRAANQEGDFLLACEEALGYCSQSPVGHVTVLDKDGLGAAVEFIGCARTAGSGTALLGRLAQLSTQLGVWVCHAASLRLEGGSGEGAAARVMDRLRRSPPRTLGGDSVTKIVDYLQGAETRSPWLGKQDLLTLGTSGGAEVSIRPSGTEPKVKIYAHLVGAAVGGTIADYLGRRQALLERGRAIAGELRALALGS